MKPKPKHTPTPWVAKAEQKVFRVTPRTIGYDIMAGTECIARVHHLGADRNAEMTANAELIASAPQLRADLQTALAALKLALDMLNHLPERIGGIGTKYVKERMDTAIAQVERTVKP